jgi:hypothetical protein
MFLVSWAFSLLGAPLLRQVALYGAVGLAGLLFVAYMRYNAASPYRAQIAALKEAVAVQQRIINDHNTLMEEHERQADLLKTQVEEFVHAAKDKDACIFTSAQLTQLRKLGGS